MNIPIIEELPDGCYRIKDFVSCDFKNNFIIDEEEIITERELKNYKKESDFEFVKEINSQFLEEVLSYKRNRIDQLLPIIKENIMIYDFIVQSGICKRETDIFKHMSELPRMIKEVKSIEKEIKSLKNGNEIKQGSITPQDIQNAKNYPFENLVDFKRDFAFCPFHPETNPSFHWNKTNNTAHCFSCGKNWDTIQFVIDTKHVSFPEAVKILK